jgi:hypothetical protein
MEDGTMTEWERALNSYVELFENTFTEVEEVKERVDGLRSFAAISPRPMQLAHYVGMALLQSRWLERIHKEEARPAIRVDFELWPQCMKLTWRDRPRWEEFTRCRKCSGTHDPKRDSFFLPVADYGHEFDPELLYMVYFRCATREDKDRCSPPNK